MPAKREDADESPEVTRDLSLAPGSAGTTEPESNITADSASEYLEKRNKRFTTWRKQRPFGAGLVMMFAGAVIMTPAYLAFEISNIQVQISTISGVSTLIIGVLLIVCGFLTWFRGEGRILTGVVSLLLGIVALPASNFGGFGLGTFLALIGGALALSWTDEDKEPRERKKRRRRAVGGGAAAAVAAVALTMASGAVTQNPEALADPVSLPRLQDVIPFLPKDEQRQSQQPAPSGVVPSGTPESSALKPVSPVPGLPNLEELRQRGEDILAGDFLKEINKTPLPKVPGIDLAAPEPLSWAVPPSGNRYMVMTDKTSLIGNVKFSYVTFDTAQGPRQGIRIDADHAILDNLSVRFPGDASGVPDQWMRSGRGVTTTLNGNFHIIVHSAEVAPQVAGLASPVALPLSADMPPEELKKALHSLGLGVPDAISEKLVLLNGTMDTYYIVADDLIAAPETTFGE